MTSMNAGGANPSASASTGDRTFQSDLNQLRDDLSQLRQDVSSMASDVFGVARENLGGTVKGFKEKGVEMADALEEQIHEHPLATVGIAFGVGLLVGALVRRG
jgi:ElaB/YqjD/DUF883 family membrane-anchored ribosome-binding protein